MRTTDMAQDYDDGAEIGREGLAFGMADTHVLRDSSLSVNARLAYGILTTYCSTTRAPFPGLEKLAEHLGVSRSTAKRAMAALRDRGIIEVRPRFGERGEQRSNLYLLRDLGAARVTGAPVPQSTGEPHPRVTHDLPPRVMGDPQNNTTMNNTTTEQETADAGASAQVLDLPGLPTAQAKAQPVERTLAAEWWEAQSPRPAGKGAWHATVRSIKAVLEAGHDTAAVRHALSQCSPPLSIGTIEFALNRGGGSTVLSAPTWTPDTEDGWTNHG
jgi:DNA-binding transcriptional ArsR family regulator